MKINSFFLTVKNNIVTFIKTKKEKVVTVVIVFSVLSVLSRLPYINLFFTVWMLLFACLITIIVVFQLRKKVYYFFAILFLIFAMFCLLVGEEQLAESFGNLVYGFLFLGILSELLQLRI